MTEQRIDAAIDDLLNRPEKKDTKVVALPDGIDFNQPIIGGNGRLAMESYFDDEGRDRGEWLEGKAQLIGRLSEPEAEELLRLRKRRPRSLGSYCVEALYYTSQEDKKLDYLVKLRRGSLARKIAGDDPEASMPTMRLEKKYRTMILDSGKPIWTPLVLTQVFLALEGEAALEDEIGEDG